MYRLLSLFSALLLLISACASSGGEKSAIRYYIHPEAARQADDKAAEYLWKHLQVRGKGLLTAVPGEGVVEVSLHVGDDFDGDYKVEYTEHGYKLAARDQRTMIWLSYQFIKHLGAANPAISVDDLPPCIFPQKDTVATFPFEYRDLYMPSNQNPDMTYLLGLHNLEMDWGIWGHQMARVLGSNGDKSFGYQNMEPELFARTAGMVHKDQFCFSSDRLLELTVQFILDQYGDGSKDHMHITIGPNDNGIVCECRRCQTMGNTRTNATSAVVAFIEKLARRFPGHQFFLPAYSTTQAFPSHPLPENVGVFLSAIDYPRTWNQQGSKPFLDKLDQWKKYTDTIYIWDYVCNFDDYLSPYPILYVMQQRFQEYLRRGVKGIFLNGSGYFYSTVQECYSFVLADLLANPYADVDRLVQEYFSDAMPHVGAFFAKVVLSMEKHAARSGKELPLYGGMDEALQSYLFEKEFREYYAYFQGLAGMNMTHRERVIFDKTRQAVSFSLLEMVRLHGLDPKTGYLDGEGNVKADVLQALEDLKMITPEEDIYLLTNNENASMDHMDRVNESGVYLADYENEAEIWLSNKWWEADILLGKPLTVHTQGHTETTRVLTDGVIGISQNYHWGWQIYPQQDLVIELPPEDLNKAHGISIAFLNCERHRMTPPKSVQLWADGVLISDIHREGLADGYDEGEKVIFRGSVSVPSYARQVEVRFEPSRSALLALDEIFMRK